MARSARADWSVRGRWQRWGAAHDEGDGEVVQRHQGLWLHHADKDAFVHISEVERSGLGRLIEGQRVNFQVRQEARGLKAVELAPDD